MIDLRKYMFISHLFSPYYFNVSVPRLLLKTNFYIATLKTIALLIKSVDSIRSNKDIIKYSTKRTT